MSSLIATDYKWQVVITFAVMATLVSTILTDQHKQFGLSFAGALYIIAGTLPIAPMIFASRRGFVAARAWRFMALGVALNTVADLIYALHDEHLHHAPLVATSDAVYLASCGAFIVGVVLLTQTRKGTVRASVRLDGVIAGFAVAALVSFFWFAPLLAGNGKAIQAMVEMAFPMFDLLMLALIVAALAPHRYRPDRSTGFLMAGVFWFVIGDVIHISQQANQSFSASTGADLTFVVGIWLMGLAASARYDRKRSAEVVYGATSLSFAIIPVLAGVVSIMVVAACLRWHRPHEVAALALAGLALVLVRMWLTLRAERRLVSTSHEDARTDALTGLPNRRFLIEQVEAMLSPDGTGRAGVILIDLDGFKEVNDALGHGAGDMLLGMIGARFVECLGRRGTLARLGGDEFAAICDGPEEKLVEIAGELLGTTTEPCLLEGLRVRLGASVGIALGDGADCTAFELLRSADVAMYDAKKNKLGISVYRAASDTNSRESLSLLNDLRDAIESHSISLHYQPTIDVRSGRIHGVEALARWTHPVHGVIHPDEFIPMAEHAGLISKLTASVLVQAVAEVARLDRAGHHLGVSVNISRHDLLDDGLPDLIGETLDRFEFPARRLTIEITESSLDEDPLRAARCVERIRARGVHISIDDFGVGYSSLSQLLGIPVDELKVDRSFMSGLDRDPRAQAIVRSAVQLGRALGLSVVAEGIEEFGVLEMLRGYGVDIGQGSLISLPLAPEQLEQFLVARRVAETAEPKRPVLLGL
jgi:diguanylate cyclase (GGDEF)-like protein